MNKLLLIFFLILCQWFEAHSQTYGNEWINYSQKYYSFPVVATGIHRINYDDLVTANVPVNEFSHQNIQLFGREKEVPIWLELNGDGTFNSGDYILFYGEKNDGWLDSNLYVNPDKIGNPKYSLFNDTIRYFFTWNNLATNLRFTEETDIDFNTYTSSDYLWEDVFQSFTNTYHQGEMLYDISSSFYVDGEGYGRGQNSGAGIGFSLDLTAATPNAFKTAGAPDAKFSAHVVTTSNAASIANPNVYIPNHHTRWSINNQQVDDQITQGYTLVKTEANFPSAILLNSTPIKFQIIGDLAVLTDWQAINFWEIHYPRIPNFSGANNFDVRIENSLSQSKIRLDIASLSYVQPLLFSLDPQNPRKLPLIDNTGVYQTLIPNSTTSSEQRIVYGNLANAITITNFESISETGYFENYSSLDFEEALLMITHKTLEATAEQYQEYRNSTDGGNYNTHLIDVDQLYLQFGGGVEKHILSIRRFAQFAYDNSTQKPVGLFLIGKGISNSLTRTEASNFNQSLIPTWGVPASDVFITSNLPGTSKWAPLIPTGRISVNNEVDLDNYLSKVIQYDLNQNQSDIYDGPNKDWQKHAIHLIGGDGPQQQIGFQQQMNGMKNKFESNLFAGQVHTIKRESDAPISPGLLNEITQRLEDGVSIITYYGHYIGSNNGFEINIDDVTNWGNTGKYPVMLVNSCYNGNIFTTGNSSSEYFVNAQNLGAIAYISTVSQGFHPYVGQYSNGMYTQFGRLSYGKTLGENMRNNIQTIQNVNNLYLETTCAQMVLNGDPMIKMNYHEKPEIELLDENVSFLPTEIDLNTDSIEIVIAMRNLGQSVLDTFTVEVRRNFPGSDIDSIYFVRKPFLNYRDTVRIKMPLLPNISLGINSFDISIDIPTIIDEQYDELNNNQITKNFFVNINGILPVTPYNFAVVPNDSVTVKASTINPLADINTYRFQIDTTDLFNSPFLRNATVTGPGGVHEVHPSDWSTPLVLEDSVVYFWRVAIDEVNPNWSEYSFQYIPGKSGWGQDHFFQFKKNNFINIDYDRTQRLRVWEPDSFRISCDVFTYNTNNIAWHIEGVEQEYGYCTPSFYVGVVDPLTMLAWETNFNGSNPDHVFGNIPCRTTRAERYFVFAQNSLSQLEAFQNMVLNEVPDGHYLIIYTPVSTNYPAWNSLDSIDMYQTFATLGATEIVPGLPNDPFIFFIKKGYPETAEVEIVNSAVGENSAHLDTYMYSSETIGQEVSTLIGPSFRWGNVYWKQDSIDLINNTDTTRLEILAFNAEKQLSFQTNVLFTPNDSIIDLNPIIDADLYPYIRLKALYKDTTNFTPAQVDRWHVLYEHVPEAAIDNKEMYTWSIESDTIIEGQDVSFAVDVKNIYNVDMDSLLIKYWIVNSNNQAQFINYPRQDSLLVGETFRDTITFSTLGLSGLNSLWMEINPFINGSLNITDQPEQHHFNNVLQLPFYVRGDDKNPILDVTFNGRHILNGDIVDPNSEIYITLKDDNEFMVMDDVSDTTLFGIYITNPSGIQTRIPFMDANGNTVMQWIPAEAQNKRFKIIYPAAFQQDGKYTLVVQGSDRSGNLSGDLEYKVTFEVISTSSITQMMNYPNPFSTSTRFVFTLTGSKVPDDIIIQIMTVSGRVVREITEEELGQIHIGRNITEYAWDGRDEFGDPLANGVYLYNVRAKINGEDIEHRESGADQYFKKNFGKMYLMR